MPLGPTLGFEEPDMQAPVIRQSSFLEVQAASYGLSAKDSDTQAIFRTYQHNIAKREDEPLVDHNVLNKEYQFQIPLNKPIKRSLFNQLVLEDMERRELQQVIANGDDSLVTQVFSFGSSVAPHILDPVGLIAGAATGALATNVAAAGLFGARAARAARGVKAGTRVKGLIQEAGEAAAGNILSELAFVMPNAEEEKREIEFEANLMNAAITGAGFAGLVKGWKLGKDAFVKSMNLVQGRIDSGKNPLPSVIEHEAATSQSRNAIDAELAELNEQQRLDFEELQSKQEGDPAVQEIQDRLNTRQAKTDELMSKRAEIEKLVSDHRSMREEANSREQELGFSRKVDEQINNFEPNAEPIEHVEFIKRDMEEQIIEAETIGDAKRVESLKAQQEETLSTIEKIEEFGKATIKCIRGVAGGQL